MSRTVPHWLQMKNVRELVNFCAKPLSLAPDTRDSDIAGVFLRVLAGKAR